MILFCSGINGVRGTVSRPSPSSIYSLTNRGEVLVFDPSAALDTGVDENSVVGSSYSQVSSLYISRVVL